MEGLWAEAAKDFQKICGESLRKGEVQSFDDVRKKIEEAGVGTREAGHEDKWQKAKAVGLEILKYLKLLVGTASQVSSFVR